MRAETRLLLTRIPSHANMARTFSAPKTWLVMLIAGGEDKILPNAIKFPKRTFQYLYAELNGTGGNYSEEFTSPFPIEVTSTMLECFEGQYVLQQQETKQHWLGCIGDIGEELWVYSKNRELLVDESDHQYLSDSLTKVRMKIENMLGSLGTELDSETESLIRDLCSEVFMGGMFDDGKYNELISCIQAMSAAITQ